MEQSRANKISEVLKNVSTLGKKIQIPGSVAATRIIPEAKNAIGVPVEGTGFVRILMYVIAGILLIGLILLGVDQWITPVFQRSPGAPGYIPIPGTDTTQVFWTDSTKVTDIYVGPVTQETNGFTPLSVTNIEGQAAYSLTLDVKINDEYPQSLPPVDPYNQLTNGRRIFFILTQVPIGSVLPIFQVSLDNNQNKVYITSLNNSSTPEESIVIDNVPIHKTFRIGVTISNKLMEGYLNGLLVSSRPLKQPPIPPESGYRIPSPSNIKVRSGLTEKVLSAGISVLNVRTFGYVASAAEMEARMSDFVFNESLGKSINTAVTTVYRGTCSA